MTSDSERIQRRKNNVDESWKIRIGEGEINAYIYKEERNKGNDMRHHNNCLWTERQQDGGKRVKRNPAIIYLWEEHLNLINKEKLKIKGRKSYVRYM